VEWRTNQRYICYSVTRIVALSSALGRFTKGPPF
jgi:hypothetical protein